MTDGYSFPADAEGQVRFIRELAAASIAGLALGEGFEAPPLTTEAIAAADELAFPVLQTARSVPFVTLARAVAEAASSGRGESRASRVLRLYDMLRRLHQPESSVDLLGLLSIELRADIHVIELRGGRYLLGSEPLPELLRTAVLERVQTHSGHLPAFNRLKDEDEESSALLLPVGTDGIAALIVRTHSVTDAPDLTLAQHAALIVELELERRLAHVSQLRARGSELVRRMLEGSIDPDAAHVQLSDHGLEQGPWTLTSWHHLPLNSDATSEHKRPIPDALAFAEWPHLYSHVGDVHLVLTHQSFAERIPDLAGLAAPSGASQPFSTMARFADAFREARWALDSARASGAPRAVYGEHGSYFMPRTVSEGEIAVRRLLGPVLDYDATHDAQLLRSLQAYFETNRSWQAGARVLGIHKQTLVYRIKKVEELTGADLRDFGVQAELYLALRTCQILGMGRLDSPA